MSFPAFLSGFLCIEQVMNKKNIYMNNMNINEQNLNRKIARLLSRNCSTN